MRGLRRCILAGAVGLMGRSLRVWSLALALLALISAPFALAPVTHAEITAPGGGGTNMCGGSCVYNAPPAYGAAWQDPVNTFGTSPEALVSTGANYSTGGLAMRTGGGVLVLQLDNASSKMLIGQTTNGIMTFHATETGMDFNFHKTSGSAGMFRVWTGANASTMSLILHPTQGAHFWSGIEGVTTARTTIFDDTNRTFTNTGDTDGAVITLLNDPANGVHWHFRVTVAQTMTIQPSAGESLYYGTSSCASISCATIGCAATVQAVKPGNGGMYMTVAHEGTWTCA